MLQVTNGHGNQGILRVKMVLHVCVVVLTLFQTANANQNSPKLLRERAEKALATGNWDSLYIYASALKVDSQYAIIASHWLAFTNLCQGNYNENLIEAMDLAKSQTAIGRGQLSKVYSRLLSEYPTSGHILLAAGDAALAEGDAAVAITLIDKAIELHRFDPLFFTILGVAFRNAGQFDKAITAYKMAIEKDSAYAPAYVNWGFACLMKRQFSEAQQKLQDAVELRPDYALAWLNLGLSHRNLGRLNEAVRCYKNAISLIPTFHSAYKNLGAAFYYLRNYKEARLAWEKVVELDPNGPEGASARRNLAKLP